MNFNEMYGLHIKYVDYLIAKSMFSHQEAKNIALSGSEVENEIRLFFKNMLPPRFRVTHGYILFAANNIDDPKLSPQVDLIIVDDFVMSKVFTLDKENGMEIIPVEAVVGIFEIKRTANKEQLEKAFIHIEKIINSVNIKKDNNKHYMAGGIETPDFNTSIHSNPFIGIISLTHDLTLINENNEWKDIDDKQYIKLQLDAIFSFSGMAILNVDENNQFKPYLVRTTDYVPKFRCMVTNSDPNPVRQSGIISRFFGYLIAYLTDCTGKRMNISNYFFHNSTCGKSNIE